MFSVSYDIMASGKHFSEAMAQPSLQLLSEPGFPSLQYSVDQNSHSVWIWNAVGGKKNKFIKDLLTKMKYLGRKYSLHFMGPWLPFIERHSLEWFLGMILWKSRIIANQREMCVSLFRRVLKICLQYKVGKAWMWAGIPENAHYPHLTLFCSAFPVG